MNTALQVQPRSLDDLAGLIKDDLASAVRAGMPYYIAAGEKLIEAQNGHFKNNPNGFWDWVERNFEVERRQATRWMDLSQETKRLSGRARREVQPFESISDFERKRGTSPRGPGVPEGVKRILNRIDTEALAQEAERRRDELDQIRTLANQIIDIGYKTLAGKLHPDRRGGSKHAMMLLNAARDRLRRSV